MTPWGRRIERGAMDAMNCMVTGYSRSRLAVKNLLYQGVLF